MAGAVRVDVVVARDGRPGRALHALVPTLDALVPTLDATRGGLRGGF